MHLELGQVQEGVEQLEAALVCDVEDINAWHTRMDAEKLLAQVRRQPWQQPSLVPPHAQQAERGAAASGGAAPAASISTAALLRCVRGWGAAAWAGRGGHGGTQATLVCCPTPQCRLLVSPVVVRSPRPD